MAFIRKKVDKTYWSYQLIESYRENKKTKKRVLFHMGKKLIIPRRIIREYRISKENVDKLRVKYPDLRIVNE